MEVGEAVNVAVGSDQKEDKEWVAFRLVSLAKTYEYGRDLHYGIYAEYKANTPNGPREGYTRLDGSMALRELSPGDCQIEFPEFYKTMKDWAKECSEASEGAE